MRLKFEEIKNPLLTLVNLCHNISDEILLRQNMTKNASFTQIRGTLSILVKLYVSFSNYPYYFYKVLWQHCLNVLLEITNLSGVFFKIQKKYINSFQR